jgi:hypothetical protein
MFSNILQPLAAFAYADGFFKLNSIADQTQKSDFYFFSYLSMGSQLDRLSRLFQDYIALSPANNITKGLQSFVEETPQTISALEKIAIGVQVISLNVTAKYRAPISGLTYVMNRLISVAFLVGTVVMIPLRPITAIPMAATMIYHAMDNQRLIPKKASLFMENYGSSVASVFQLFDPSNLLKLHALSQIGTIFSRASRPVYTLIDRVLTHKSIPTIDQVRDKTDFKIAQLTRKHIYGVFEEKTSYTINPVMTARPFHKFTRIQSDSNFDEFLTLFDQIDANLIQEKMPTCGLSLDAASKKEAAEKNIPEEEMLRSLIRAKLVELVQILKGEKYVTGSFQAGDGGIKNAKVILGYLKKYCPQNDSEALFQTFCDLVKVDFKDGSSLYSLTLNTKIAMYQMELENEQLVDNAQHSAYELELLRRLEKLRIKTSNLVSETMLANENAFTKAMTKNTFKFGFVPLDKEYLNQYGLTSIFLKNLGNGFEQSVRSYKNQALDCVASMDKEQTRQFVHKIINESDLPDHEKTTLLDVYDNLYQDESDNGKIYMRHWYHLILLRLGVETAEFPVTGY